MKIINLINIFWLTYKSNVIMNTILISLILVIVMIICVKKKLKLSALLQMAKAELKEIVSGQEKMERVLDWFLTTNIYNNTILKLIPKSYWKWFLQKLYNKHKELIKTK